MMLICIVCFGLMVFVQFYGWYIWVFGILVVVFLYIVVVFVNVGSDSIEMVVELLWCELDVLVFVFFDGLIVFLQVIMIYEGCRD